MTEQEELELYVDNAPRICTTCNAALCLRKQVINLALGNELNMYCLDCLGSQTEQSPEKIITNLKTYILGRDCFAKQWRRYKDVNYCPDRLGCVPSTCFTQ